jgi:putative FmdB family regulatory protein
MQILLETKGMPLFSYECEDCQAQCEVLVRGGEQPVCPECGSSRLVKQASGFAALSGSGAGAAPPPCAASGCCQAQGGSCPLG